MAASAQAVSGRESELEARYQARLEREVERLREQSRRAVEDFKRSFPPPSDEQIERLLYPELSEFQVELGGRRFTLRELPAVCEKRFLRLVEQKLPALVAEILKFEDRLDDDAQQGFARMLARATQALDLITEACALVLDPAKEHGVTAEFVQQHASTARQLRILKAQLLLNGARDFLSQLFPVLRQPEAHDAPAPRQPTPEGLSPDKAIGTPASPPPSVGSNSLDTPPAKLQDSSPWDNSL
jgi:hypothetical protein